MKKRYVIGMDVSTSCTGICVLDKDIEPDAAGSHIVLLTYEPFKKCKTMWDKADRMGSQLVTIAVNPALVVEYEIFVEEALLGFRPGLSSATTIASLLRFNGIVSYIARNTFNVEPQFVSAPHARKVCGIKLQKTSTSGKSQKQQVFDHMMQNDLKHIKWPLKKNGVDVVDGAGDATDAYVIARAGILMNS